MSVAKYEYKNLSLFIVSSLEVSSYHTLTNEAFNLKYMKVFPKFWISSRKQLKNFKKIWNKNHSIAKTLFS